MIGQRKSVIQSLRFAKAVAEQADKENLTNQELLTAIEIIKSLHKEKATAATAAISFELDGKEIGSAINEKLFGDSEGNVPTGKKMTDPYKD